jgi:hypothetical protein
MALRNESEKHKLILYARTNQIDERHDPAVQLGSIRRLVSHRKITALAQVSAGFLADGF